MPWEARAQAAPAPREEPLPADGAAEVAVEYVGDAPVLVQGAASSRVYTFSPGRRMRNVPAADATQLLRHGQFRRAARGSQPSAHL